jgi:hypothetical protein
LLDAFGGGAVTQFNREVKILVEEALRQTKSCSAGEAN